jgi:hypothetical protein
MKSTISVHHNGGRYAQIEARRRTACTKAWGEHCDAPESAQMGVKKIWQSGSVWQRKQSPDSPITGLLAGSSPAVDDQAAVINAWISELRIEDREYVLGLVKAASEHLRRKR